MTTIITKNSSTAGAVPTASDLVQGELAVNVTDKALYTENASGTVVKLNAPSIVDNGNATAITIDSSENVGVGATPSAWYSTLKALEVNGGFLANKTDTVNFGLNAYLNTSGTWTYKASAAASYYEQYGGQHTWYRAASGTAGNPISWTQAMTLDASGNLMINATTAAASLTLPNTAGSAGAINKISLYAISSTPLYGFGVSTNQLNYNADGAHVFYNNSGGGSTTERARIDSSGVFSVQNASTSGGIQIIRSDMNSQSTSGQTSLYLGDTGSGIKAITREKAAVNTAYTRIYSEYGYGTHTLGASFFNTVAYQGNNSTTWSTTSDERVKTNIRPISDALGKICALNAVHFEYKNAIGKTKTSFIAQEFEQVFPGHVHEVPAPDDLKEFVGEDGMMKALDPELIPYLVAAIQEQQTIIQQLQADLAALKGQA